MRLRNTHHNTLLLKLGSARSPRQVVLRPVFSIWKIFLNFVMGFAPGFRTVFCSNEFVSGKCTR